MIKLGENICKYRKEAGLSQTELASKVYVTPQAVSRWERGITEPDLNTLENISKALNIKIEQLIEGENAVESYTFQRLIHIIYLIGSIVMITFSMVLITTYFWKPPFGLYLAFVICSLLFLTAILVFEILKERSIRKNKKIKQENKNNSDKKEQK